MSLDTRPSDFIHVPPFPENNQAVHWLSNLLKYEPLVANKYTKALRNKWDRFLKSSHAIQNASLQGANAPNRKILVITISAYSHPMWRPLLGPKNDWKFWAMLSMMAGWSVDIVADSFQAVDSSRAPTKENIRCFIQALVEDNKAGDQFIVVFSGHGDPKGLVLADGSYISPQELRSWLVHPLNSESTLWTFFDCCHSSNILGLPQKILCVNNSPLDYQLVRSHVGHGDADARGTVISIGSAAGPSGEMNLTEQKASASSKTKTEHCGPLAFAAYTLFCSGSKGGEPQLAKFCPILADLIKTSGQDPQITASSILQNPLLPSLHPLPA